MIALLGYKSNSKAPPPTNGSKYLLNVSGTFCRNFNNTCLLPPGQCIKGFNAGTKHTSLVEIIARSSTSLSGILYFFLASFLVHQLDILY